MVCPFVLMRHGSRYRRADDSCSATQAPEYKGRSLSGIGGVETGADAAEFILLGSDTVQVRGGAVERQLLFLRQGTPVPCSLTRRAERLLLAALARALLTQVCTGVMIHGYPVVKNLCGGLQRFMTK